MRITAAQIASWASSKEAQTSLPRLVRRLIHGATPPQSIAFPAGDSTGLPGWDGTLESREGTPWVPKGSSFWELSCQGQVTAKANRDYRKRTRATKQKVRRGATLVFVSGRQWPQKSRWITEKRRARQWRSVRAYDADDLEQWIEQTPAVVLQFSEELGLAGDGIQSPARAWESWSQQSDPAITADALFVGRETARDDFLSRLRHGLDTGQGGLQLIKADSVEEAVAFACAALLTQPDLSASTVVVSAATAWRYVEQNPAVKVAVATRPEIASAPPDRRGLIVIVPYAAGDMDSRGSGEAPTDVRVKLIARPRIHEFEKALVSLGLDEADSRRLATSTGRSWSVFRRRCALNPAIRRPVWLDLPQAQALSVLCLVGEWSSGHPADQAVVGRVSGRPYEEVERELRHLALLEDAPVLQIGAVWKAKSPLELLHLFGDRITGEELERFFQVTVEILTAADPQLELPDEERHAAALHKKIRAESGSLLRALGSTLVKLAVRGLEVAGLATANVVGRVAAVVDGLLRDADGTRWLSLASLLPSLAEAAPDAFLTAVEASLTKADAPVLRLFTETSGAALFGRCWHAGLLWGLELLAWAPERMTRVALLLARLAHVEIKGNWANSPHRTLVNIFRSWLPQTAADLSQRVAALDVLMAREPVAAFDLLDALVRTGADHASPSARPDWRDEDSGAGHGVPPTERQAMLIAAADQLIASTSGDASRIARLIHKTDMFDDARMYRVLSLTEPFAEPSALDVDREVLRTALRNRIDWQRNLSGRRGKTHEERLKALEACYAALAPRDLVLRHRWLFATSDFHPPIRADGTGFARRGELQEAWRLEALRELFAERGLAGVEQLAVSSANPLAVGATLAKLGLEMAQLIEWMADREVVWRSPLALTMSGVLCSTPVSTTADLIRAVLDRGRQHGWGPEQIAGFLMLAQAERATWDIAAGCGPEVERAYWTTIPPQFWVREPSDLTFALRRLLDAGRPRSALHVCQLDLNAVDAPLLAEMLERMLRGEESNGPLPEPWHIGEAIEQLEGSGVIDRDRLVRLEFGLFPALGLEGEHRAKVLFGAVVSTPHLFCELLCLLYRPAGTPRSADSPAEAQRAAADTAWHVLHACRTLPGSHPDGTIDPGAFARFVDETRDLCRAAGRLDACDSHLGQILAHAPTGPDGVWPGEPARTLLDRPELTEVRGGFEIGTHNKRGMTSRAYDEGGAQERTLADTFRTWARTLQKSHVYLAATLERIARGYEEEGVLCDVHARLRREGS